LNVIGQVMLVARKKADFIYKCCQID